MKVVLCSLALLAVVQLSTAALAIAPLEEKPDQYKDTPGCYISELSRVLPVGGTAASGRGCQQYRCSTTHVQIETCGAVAAAPPLKVVSDVSKPYPGCCPRIVH